MEKEKKRNLPVVKYIIIIIVLANVLISVVPTLIDSAGDLFGESETESYSDLRIINVSSQVVPDFQGRTDLVQQVIDAGPEVISHNLETVRRLSDSVRSRATYEVSLKVIGQIAASQCVAKSGIMLGLGETREEILKTMDDLRNVGCQVMTIGQYLQPTAKNTEVKEYIRPEVFEEYKEIGLRKGFTFVESGPLVRSSYHAERHIKK